VVAAYASLTQETGSFEGTLLSDVLHLGARPDAVTGRGREQVVDELALRLSPGAPAALLRHDQHADLPRADPAAFVLAPVN
jgi:hypothetical protein